MTFKSKRTLTSMAAGIVLLAAYVVHARGKTPQYAANLQSWAISMLVFIGIAVAAQIVLQILFHIAFSIGLAVREAADDNKVERILASLTAEDEMERLIALKSAHIGYICAGAGFIAALAALVLGASVLCALHILFGAFALGALAEGAVSVYLYESGVRNG